METEEITDQERESSLIDFSKIDFAALTNDEYGRGYIPEVSKNDFDHFFDFMERNELRFKTFYDDPKKRIVIETLAAPFPAHESCLMTFNGFILHWNYLSSGMSILPLDSFGQAEVHLDDGSVYLPDSSWRIINRECPNIIFECAIKQSAKSLINKLKKYIRSTNNIRYAWGVKVFPNGSMLAIAFIQGQELPLFMINFGRSHFSHQAIGSILRETQAPDNSFRGLGFGDVECNAAGIDIYVFEIPLNALICTDNVGNELYEEPGFNLNHPCRIDLFLLRLVILRHFPF